MNQSDLKARTQAFASRIIRLVESLPNNKTAEVLGRQLLRSGTSVAANYRASCRAKSHADFVAKMGVVEEEADESVFWMELLSESCIVRRELIENLMDEGHQIVKIIVASIKTARAKNPRTKELKKVGQLTSEPT